MKSYQIFLVGLGGLVAVFLAEYFIGVGLAWALRLSRPCS